MAKGKLGAAIMDRTPPRARPQPASQQDVFEFLLLILKAIKRNAFQSKQAHFKALSSTIANFAGYVDYASRLYRLLKALEAVGRVKVPPKLIRSLREMAPILGRAPEAKDVKLWQPLLDKTAFQATRRTGAIKEIRALEFADGSIQVEIGGDVLPSIAAIRASQKFPQQGVFHTAQDFSIGMRSAKDLTYGGVSIEGYQRAHLWGHGFGDEARVGLMYAPDEVNQILQSKGVEKFIREQAEIAARDGGTVRLVTTAKSHPPKPPSNLRRQDGEFLLAELKYEMVHLRKDGTMVVLRTTLKVPPPPGRPVNFSVDAGDTLLTEFVE